MKKIFVMFILLFGCNSTPDSKVGFKRVLQVDYTFDSGWKEAYSIKINSKGVCVIGDGRRTIKYFIGQLSQDDMQNLDSLVQHIPFNKYDSTYHEDVVDQAAYKFILINTDKDTITKFVYGKTAPQLLNDFSNKLRQIKEKLNVVSKDTIVDFASRINFFPPTSMTGVSPDIIN